MTKIMKILEFYCFSFGGELVFSFFFFGVLSNNNLTEGENVSSYWPDFTDHMNATTNAVATREDNKIR